MKQIAALVLFAAACSGQLLYGAAPFAGLPHAGLPIAGLPLTGLPSVAGVGYHGLPLNYAAASGLPLTYAAASGLPLTYASAGVPVATTAIAPASPALRDAELEKIVNNPGHATSYRVRPDIPEASRKRRDLTAISGLPLAYNYPYFGSPLTYTASPLTYTAGNPFISGLPLAGVAPLNYAAPHAAIATAVTGTPAIRDAELEKVVNNPGHATSYRVRPDIA